MPVYEFKCEDCGKKFDIVATLAEKESGLSPACPKCGGMRVRQVFGRFTLLSGSKSDVEDEDFGDSGPDEDFGDDAGLDEFDDQELGEGFDDDM
uniref:Zinc ribbon domain-containing protein n=1 Tax=candidate division WOR-3 bacterium TaxID=2052148 RepID=A0A7C4G9I2_UNCW3